MNKTLFIALLALGVVGCAGTTDLAGGMEARNEGLAIASFTLTGKALDEYSDFEFRFRLVQDNTQPVVTKRHFDSATQHARLTTRSDDRDLLDGRVVVKGSHSSEALDINENGSSKGRLAILRLPAGEYEFFAWRLRRAGALGSTEYGPPQNFSHRFTVAPGSATYLGQLDLRMDSKSAAVAVSDRRGRDFALIQQKMPSLDLARVRSDGRQLHP